MNLYPFYCFEFIFLKLHLFTPKIQTILFPDAAGKMWKSKFSLITSHWAFNHKCSTAKVSA